jgi:hypothetical protein
MYETYVAPYAKAYVPTLVGLGVVVLLELLEPAGVLPEMTVREALGILLLSLLNSAGVYKVRNRQ